MKHELIEAVVKSRDAAFARLDRKYDRLYDAARTAEEVRAVNEWHRVKSNEITERYVQDVQRVAQMAN